MRTLLKKYLLFAVISVAAIGVLRLPVSAEETASELPFVKYEWSNEDTNISIEQALVWQGMVFEYHKMTDTLSLEALVSEQYKDTIRLDVPSEVCGKPVTEIDGYGIFDTAYGRITELNMPDTITGNFVADGEHGAYSLKKVTLSKNLDSWTFMEITGLSEIRIPENAVSTGRFQNCGKLKKIVLPDTVKTVSSCAFQSTDGKSALKEMLLPEGVTKIEERAFWGCRKLKLYVPASVKKIGKQAFGSGSGKIKLLYCVKNSAAHKYAKKNKIPYKLVSKKVSQRKVTDLAPVKKKLTLKAGETCALQITIKPFYAKGQSLTYQSGKKSVAKVSKSGVVTARKKGKAVVTIKAKSGVKTKVTVVVQ